MINKKKQETQVLHARVDPLIYYKIKDAGLNVSDLVSKLLDEYFIDDIVLPEQKQLEDDIKKDEEKIAELKKDVLKKTVLLSKVKQDNEQMEKERYEQKVAMYDSMRRSATFVDRVTNNRRWR